MLMNPNTMCFPSSPPPSQQIRPQPQHQLVNAQSSSLSTFSPASSLSDFSPHSVSAFGSTPAAIDSQIHPSSVPAPLLITNSNAIRSEVVRFESVHPAIYAIYDLLEQITEPELYFNIKEQVINIEGTTFSEIIHSRLKVICLHHLIIPTWFVISYISGLNHENLLDFCHSNIYYLV